MEVSLRIINGPERLAVLGPADRNIKMIREALGVHVTAREGKVSLSGVESLRKWLRDDKVNNFLELWKQIVDNNTIQLTEKQ